MHHSETARAAPAIAGSDPHKASCLAADGSENAPKAHVAQAKIELLREDIAETIGWFIPALNSAIAMLDASDIIGTIYALRRCRAYWLHIASCAAELVAVNAEMQSAPRQGGG
jgi:hypothetical protein